MTTCCGFGKCTGAAGCEQKSYDPSTYVPPSERNRPVRHARHWDGWAFLDRCLVVMVLAAAIADFDAGKLHYFPFAAYGALGIAVLLGPAYKQAHRGRE